MNRALQLVYSTKKTVKTQVVVDTNTAPENDNNPILHSVRKAWKDRERLPVLVKAVIETPTWQKLMPMFGTLADVLIDSSISKTKRIELQKTLKEAILLMWYSYMQSQKKLAAIDKNQVGNSTIHLKLIPHHRGG